MPICSLLQVGRDQIAWSIYDPLNKKGSEVKINSLDHLIKEIESFSKNVQNSNENELKDKKNFLKKVLGNQYESKGQLDKYVNFYKNL